MSVTTTTYAPVAQQEDPPVPVPLQPQPPAPYVVAQQVPPGRGAYYETGPTVAHESVAPYKRLSDCELATTLVCDVVLPPIGVAMGTSDGVETIINW